MLRFAPLAAMLLLAGCTTAPDTRVDRRDSPCPARYTLACEVAPGTNEIVADTCACVRTSELNAMFRSRAFGPGRGFRSRIR